LLQLRTGHIPLNQHLHRIGKSTTPKCPHCPFQNETVHKFPMLCPSYAAQRYQMEKKLGRGAKSIHNLLSHPNAFPPLFTFIKNTNRFVDFS
ncbi:hypothetical protein K439DRAFT_1346665, partial [Ramaria rubella]